MDTPFLAGPSTALCLYPLVSRRRRVVWATQLFRMPLLSSYVEWLS